MRTTQEITSNLRFDGDCLRWVGGHDGNGYGQLYWESGSIHLHRLIFQLAGIKIPDGLVVDHMCHVRDCIKYSHLRFITQEENLRNRDLTGIWLRKFNQWKQYREQYLNYSVYDSIKVTTCV